MGYKKIYVINHVQVVSSYNYIYDIQRTPSDVPRTAELIEMSSGPGKTVTEYDKSSQTYKTGTLHFISGITPIKDTTYASTGKWAGSNNVSYDGLNGTLSSL